MQSPRTHRECASCSQMFHVDELNTVDVEEYGEHNTIEICDDCKNQHATQPAISETINALDCALLVRELASLSLGNEMQGDFPDGAFNACRVATADNQTQNPDGQS